MSHPLLTRPCGVCQALVPYDLGCSHWRPGMSTETNKARATPSEEKRLKRNADRARQLRERRARQAQGMTPAEQERLRIKRERDVERYRAMDAGEKAERAMKVRERRRAAREVKAS